MRLPSLPLFPVRPWSALVVAAGLAYAGYADAQTANSCDRMRSELAAVETAIATKSNTDTSAALKRAQRELDRTIAYANSIGCNDFRVPLFSGAAPAKCPSLQAQIGQLEQNIQGLQDEAARNTLDDLEEQRDTLKAALDEGCSGATPPTNTPERAGVTPFGGPASDIQSSEMPDDPQARISASVANGFRTICVRSCDGYFFPISQFGATNRISADSELCHASCPGTEVSLYLQPNNKEVSEAISAEGGQPYTALPNAFHNRNTLDPTCGCRVPGKSWAETLADAERILSATGQSDTMVTELKAQELSRPRDLKVQVKGKKGEVAPPPVAPLDVAALQGTVPAGTSIIPVGEGDVREITLADGTKKKIRILRAPGTAAITSSTPE
jgi:Protein of unknown function (DUF2865)